MTSSRPSTAALESRHGGFHPHQNLRIAPLQVPGDVLEKHTLELLGLAKGSSNVVASSFTAGLVRCRTGMVDSAAASFRVRCPMER